MPRVTSLVGTTELLITSVSGSTELSQSDTFFAFDEIGRLSADATTGLLLEYPDTQRPAVLDSISFSAERQEESRNVGKKRIASLLAPF